MRLGFLSSMIMGNALVDMYSKCNDISSAREIFEGIAILDIISWMTNAVTYFWMMGSYIFWCNYAVILLDHG